MNNNHINNCVFCNIINKIEPRMIYEETDDLLVIQKQKKPRKIKLPVNVLIIPKKHIENFKHLDITDPYDATIVSKMIFMAQSISKQLTGTGDFWISVNNGANARQTVFHTHMHFKSWEAWPSKIGKGQA